MKRSVPLAIGALLLALATTGPVAAQDETTTSVDPVQTTTSTTTTTIELSAPSVTSTSPPATSPSTTAAPPSSTVAAQVRGAQETNDGELAVTGLDAGVLAALGAALLVVGGGAVTGARRR